MYRRFIQGFVATVAVLGISATAAAAAVTYVVSDKSTGTGVISSSASGTTFQSTRCTLVSDGDIDSTGKPIKFQCSNNGTITTNSNNQTIVNGTLQSADGTTQYVAVVTQDATNPSLYHLKGKGNENDPGDPGQPPCSTPVKVSGSVLITSTSPSVTYKNTLVVKEPSTAC